MKRLIDLIREEIGTLSKAVLSSPGKKCENLPTKIALTKKQKKDGSYVFLAEEQVGKKAFHKNLSPDQVCAFFAERIEENAFRQVNLFFEDKEVSFQISKKGKVTQKVNRAGGKTVSSMEHNRQKNYLIREGDRVPFLVSLGVFTQDFKIVSTKYDKFRQINRFTEILDHAFSSYEKDDIHVLDFGCGKSYLTFLIYYYFSVIKGKRVHITGYDLKEDVVENCNALAKKYGYHGLEFVVADVTRDTLSGEKIDFVISLHACDTATDHALNFALEKKVPYIFSVPCCQHEVNETIRPGGGDLDLFLSHGLFKERAAALLTDAIRAKVLESEGYRVDVLEFVDFAHSPKNLMLRAKRVGGKKTADLSPLLEMEKAYGFRQTLLHLRKDKE